MVKCGKIWFPWRNMVLCSSIFNYICYVWHGIVQMFIDMWILQKQYITMSLSIAHTLTKLLMATKSKLDMCLRNTDATGGDKVKILWMALFSWVPIFVDGTKMTHSWGSKVRGHSIFLYNSYRKLLIRGYWNSWIGPSTKTTKIDTPRKLSHPQYSKNL